MVTFGRDGVSEGQFYQVLLHELDAIRKVAFLSFPFFWEIREIGRDWLLRFTS